MWNDLSKSQGLQYLMGVNARHSTFPILFFNFFGIDRKYLVSILSLSEEMCLTAR